MEISVAYQTDAFRTIYMMEVAGSFWVVYVFKKKSKKGRSDSQTGSGSDHRSSETIKKGAIAMSNNDFELVRGSGNVFRDQGVPDADVKQAKALLVAQIIRALENQSISVKTAASLTGFAAADFSRLRNAELGRFSIDRLIKMLAALDDGIEVSIQFTKRPTVHRPNASL